MGQSQSHRREEGEGMFADPEIVEKVVLHLSWADRMSVYSVNKAMRAFLATESTWRFLTMILGRETNLYISSVSLAPTWNQSFFEYFKIQKWLSSDADGVDQPDAGLHFKIAAYARMRPRRHTGGSSSEPTKVMVPLHQRLQMIKRSRQCSDSEARRVLWSNGEDFAVDHWATASIISDGNSSSKLTATHSHSNTEKKRDASSAATVRAGVLSARGNSVVVCAPNAGVREFVLNSVLPATAQQSCVYDETGRRVVTGFLNGVNGTIFMFGQTGSGKTYTMFGPVGEVDGSLASGADAGLVPRAISEIFDMLEKCSQRGIKAILTMAYVEILGKDVANLLDSGEKVGGWTGIAARSVLEGVADHQITSRKEAWSLLAKAETVKTRAATAMNEHSSRAHTVLVFNLSQEHRSGLRVKSKLYLADLGGSEQLKKSKAIGERFDEAVHINMGLLALKNCIDALNSGSSHVPYNSSTLTQLLQDGLGGGCQTSVVVTASTEPNHAAETMHALRFGERALGIENTGQLNLQSGVSAIDALDAEISDLAAQIKKQERWENRVITRTDIDGEETVVKSVLVGAEDLRGKYEELLLMRDEMAGR